MRIEFNNKSNASFKDYGRKRMTIWVLRQLIKKLKTSNDTCGSIIDINGNNIGEWDIDLGNNQEK